ncbi:MAG: MotA/TolQ/ExbB proton channel family protein [Pseudomonadota bacterium]
MSSSIRIKALVATALIALFSLMGAAARAQESPAPAEPAPDILTTPVAEEPVAVPIPVGEAAAATEQVENPYGLSALWKQGDAVAKGVLIIMLIMSAATWYLLIVKLIEQQKLYGQARQANKSFWGSKSVKDGLVALKNGTAFWYIADRGITAADHHEGTLVEQIDRSSWITMSINRAVEEIQSRLQGGLSVLATVGSTAPFIGLFGTVWGIYHALTAIGISGQASIDKVAGPVGEALIMTAIGLAVAVPAVIGYNWLVRRNKTAMDKIRGFAADLHSLLLGAKVGG